MGRRVRESVEDTGNRARDMAAARRLLRDVYGVQRPVLEEA